MKFVKNLIEDFNKKKSDRRLIIRELKKGASKLYQDKSFLNKFGKLLIAAREQQIKLQSCDVNSLNVINQSEPILDENHRLNVGNACMIRSIEALQFQKKHPKFLLLVGLAHAPTIAHELGVPSCYIGDKKTVQDFLDLIKINNNNMSNASELINKLKELMKVDALNENDNLFAIGLDSIKAIELTNFIEETYNKKFENLYNL